MDKRLTIRGLLYLRQERSGICLLVERDSCTTCPKYQRWAESASLTTVKYCNLTDEKLCGVEERYSSTDN